MIMRKNTIDWNKEKDNLIKLINVEHLSYVEIGKLYGCSNVNIKKTAKKLGIELTERHINYGKRNCVNCGKEIENGKRGKLFCCEHCHQEHLYKEYIKRWKNGFEKGCKGSGVSKYIIRYLREKYNNSCQLCGWSKVNTYTNKVPLHVHHIDGDCTNNKEENLQLLCPNCHSLTENFAALNIGTGQRDLRYNKKTDAIYHFGVSKENVLSRVMRENKITSYNVSDESGVIRNRIMCYMQMKTVPKVSIAISIVSAINRLTNKKYDLYDIFPNLRGVKE